MDEERFVSARENPRNLGFSNCNNNNNNNNKAMSNDLVVQKAPPPVLDRFRALLKEREEEIRVSVEDDVPPPSTEEIVRLYELVLSELIFNSKPIITDLTIIAGEQREHGEGIADAICARIVEVPVEQKLPSLYLLDSIVKNIGREYIRYFSSRLPEVFCEAYWQVQPNLHPAMRHLFGTWSAVFPPSVLRKIETQLQFSPPESHQSSGLTPLRASESPRPTHGIHVNPKYLEARRQFGNSTVDNNIQHARGPSSTLKVYEQKPSIGYDEYDSDHAEVLSSQIGAQRLSSTGSGSRASFALGTEKLLPSSTARFVRSSSPSRTQSVRSLSPPIDEFVVDNSPRRVVERPSPSHPGFGYGLGRVRDRDEETNDWRRKHWSNDNYQRFETSAAYKHSNGHEHERPRALIDAYGNDRGKKPSIDKPLKVEHLDINGIDSKVTSKTWQNTEEEEYVWEDMSPTLADRSKSNDLLPSSIPHLGSFRTRPGLGTLNAAPLEPDLRRRNWSSEAQLSVVDDSSIIIEDEVPTLASGRGSMSKISGFRNETTQILGSRHPRDAWNIPQYLPQPSQNHLNTKGRGNFQMPFSAGGMSSSAGEKMPPLLDNFSDADAQFCRPSTVASRGASSSFDPLNVEALSTVVPASTGLWPPVNVHKSHPPPLLPILPQQRQIRSQFDLMNASNTNKTSFLPQQHFDSIENKTSNPRKLLQLPNQAQAGLIPLNQQNQGQVTLPQHFLQSQEARENFVSSIAVPVPSHLLAPPLNHGYIPQGHGAAMSSVLLNPIPGVRSSIPIHNIPNSSLHLQGGSLPPLPPGPPPASSQKIPLSQNAGSIVSNQPSGNAFSGLISSLMAQGLISITKQAPVEDSVGVEFNLELLKVRHESAISALYAELPRQCTTCGLRFKCQEEHSSHMDWHVTKNRISKNRKQKPSRKWFVSSSMWLSGAEALGTDSVPGFLPTETIVEKKDDEEMAVPADEDQNVCALCGEPFDDFYSDETEEWMYKGAVYLNSPDGSTAGMDRSLLGPIVHAKCRSESSVISPEDFGQYGGGNTEEGNQRKRMRS